MRKAGRRTVHGAGFCRRISRGLVAATLVALLGATAASAATPGVPLARPDFAAAALQFEEPLVLTRETSPEEDAALAAAIVRDRATNDVSALAAFAEAHPDSGWRLAVLTNLGLAYYRTGYFSKAVDAFEDAWTAGKDATELHARRLADRAAGELLRMHARLGHAERLAVLLDAMEGRGLTGKASEWRDGAREGLWTMRHAPGIAYLCGPSALKNLLLARGMAAADMAFLDSYQSGPHGVTLAEVGQLAARAKLPFHLIRRAPGEDVPVPSIVHWKVNHFATVLGERDGRYELADPTFGQPHMWVTRAALDAEASGYFLVPDGPRDSRWQAVSDAEAGHVYGMGYTDTNDPSDTDPDDVPCQCGGSSNGMTTYSFTEMLVSLRLTDTPVGYTPPKGPPVKVVLTYNQREASQPANFSFFNVSPKWTLNWLSYIVDDPNGPGNAERVVAGGGYVVYLGYNPATHSFAPDLKDASVTTVSAGGPVTYTRTLADGSVQIYAASNGATSYPRLVFLSRMIDPAGNAVSLTYDGMSRLTAITDATGRNTTLSYGNATAPLQVTQITDPFGRSAKIAYDGSGRLSQITDVLGLVSKFGYDASSLVNVLTTPYGTTKFSYGDNGNSRYLQATDPLGFTERVEYVQGLASIPSSDPPNTVPVGIVAPFNCCLNDRDTFYWDKHAYAVAAGDYTKARNRHWAHLSTNGGETSDTIESIRNALEGRIWFNYPGQPTTGLGAGQSGTLNKPSAIGRVLDDGTTQLTRISYNALGNPVTTIDPLGRSTTVSYAPNQTDVTAIQQSTSAGLATTARFTFNAQHRPLTATDAAGQTTSFSYNAAGQVTTQTDPLGNTTSYTYNPLGYLLNVVNANGHVAARFTYDTAGRVATRTDSQGWAVAYAYDALDRVTKETYPDGTTRTYAYSNLDLASIKDRQGRVTSYAHDTVRNLISVTDPLGRVTTYGYYENGVPKTLTDPNGHVTTWTIDLQNRVTAKIFADGTQATNTYEMRTSRLHAVTDALGQTKQYFYTEDDRPAAIEYLHAVNPTPAVGFTYDPYFPRVATMTDGSGTTTYTYNLPGVPGALQLALEAPPAANSAVAYGYDALGRMVSRSVGGDAETFAYDPVGRVMGHTDDLGGFQRSYLGQTDQLTRQTNGRVGTAWAYAANLNDRRLTGVVNSSGASHFAYTTTPENDITAITEGPYQQTWSYAYDAADELKSATSSLGPAYGYAYDGAGNLGSITTPAGTATIASNSVNQIATAGAFAFSYDANGNLLADYARTYQWDAENRLIGIGYPATPGAFSSFRYDGLGRRTAIVSTTGGVSGETHYGWCGQALCQARTAADVPSRRYLSEGEASLADGSLLYYGVDHLGSVRDVIVAANGLKAAHFDYDPYGNPTRSLGSRLAWTDFRYAGLFYHQQSGLYLATHRTYDPVVGRWTSRDPIGERGGRNLLAYGADGPITRTDVYGLDVNVYAGYSGSVVYGAGTELGTGVYASSNGGYGTYNSAALGSGMNVSSGWTVGVSTGNMTSNSINQTLGYGTISATISLDPNTLHITGASLTCGASTTVVSGSTSFGGTNATESGNYYDNAFNYLTSSLPVESPGDRNVPGSYSEGGITLTPQY
jgi:RHS repeat-associated protein